MMLSAIILTVQNQLAFNANEPSVLLFDIC